MTVRNQEKKGRILTIEHPTDSSPALMVLSGNAGQLLRGDIPTINILKAMRQRAHRNGVPFVLHLQEAGAVRKNSVGMTRLLEDVFEDEVTIFQYGPQESNGLIRTGLDQYTVSSITLSVRARSIVREHFDKGIHRPERYVCGEHGRCRRDNCKDGSNRAHNSLDSIPRVIPPRKRYSRGFSVTPQ